MYNGERKCNELTNSLHIYGLSDIYARLNFFIGW